MKNCPSYSLSEYTKELKKVRALLGESALIGVTLTGPSIRAIIQQVANYLIKERNDETVGSVTYFALSDELMKIRESVTKALYDWLTERISKVLDDRTLQLFVRWVVGHRQALVEGIIPHRWDGDPVWGLVQCVSAEPVASKKDRLLCLSFVCLQGVATNTEWTVYCGHGFTLNLLKKIGGNAYVKDYLPEHIAGMYFTAIVERDGSDIRMADVFPNSSQRTWNKRLLAARREDGCTGPFESGTCHLCPYGLNSCVKSFLPTDWKEGVCLNGHPGYLKRPGTLCLSCLHAGKKHETNEGEYYGKK